MEGQATLADSGRCDVSLLQFTEYVRAAGPHRLNVVTGQVARVNEPYAPARDFYRRFLLAVVAGRRMNNDRAAVQQVVRDAIPRKTSHYAQLGEGWLSWVPEIEDTRVLPNRTVRWQASDMAVKVTPNLLVEHPEGRVDAVRLYLKVAPLEPEQADVMLWLMSQVAHQLHPNGANPVVVDVRRGIGFRPDSADDGFSAWMRAEAVAYRAMWTMVA